MKTIFKTLKIDRLWKSDKLEQKSTVAFYVPGINSGVYNPPSLHISIVIEEVRAGWFRLIRRRSSTGITLTIEQFDELFGEMRKIKGLRDSIK